MPTLPIYQVDAFTERPFAGNPAAVCPLSAPIPESLMRDIAAENNLSETAFFHPQAEAFGLRWFTPTTEVDLCGHATLASAYVLMTELEPARTEVVFSTRSGALPVRRGSNREMILDFPVLPAAPADPVLVAGTARALRGEAVEILQSRQCLLAVLRDEEAVRAVRPDLSAIAATGHTLCITAPAAANDGGIDFVSRYFAPAHGVDEDPVTGSAHCTLTPYWAARLGKASLRARQVSRRGGDLNCTLVGDRVAIGGRAVLVMVGELRY